tara:strand:- start:268 stop:462 length:195 start_codon:yes stop_codon:yes gene_type:complete
MSKMSNIHLVLTNLVDEGVQSGYFGHRLEEYVMDEALGYKIPASIAKGFVEQELAECEEEIFND